MKTWDIFCRVVDNYGDIGVCWRLARQLATEHPINVRLWVDELAALVAICPNAKILPQQNIAGVEICEWPESFSSSIVPANVVIEAFACNLPQKYIAAMAQQKQLGKLTQWFNLEYLSAEEWVEGCHGLTALDPQTGLSKTWFFPGFSTKTGGLIREQHLLSERDRFTQNNHRLHAWRAQLAGYNCPVDALYISIFAYENPGIGSLLQTWQSAPNPIICFIPQGKILNSITTYLKKFAPNSINFEEVGVQQKNITLGNLELIIIPFLQQQDYDRLLWACDLNFVRGEDSFVRAQWAEKPLIWHIYPQDDNAHLEKLEAFLERYAGAEPTAMAEAIKALNRHWNLGNDCTQAWKSLLDQRQNWAQHDKIWVNHLKSLGDLTSNMVQFCQKTL